MELLVQIHAAREEPSRDLGQYDAAWYAGHFGDESASFRKIQSWAWVRSNRLHVLRLLALRAVDNLELHGLPLVQRLVPFLLDRRELNENVRAALVPSDEPVALRGVKPLHLACFACHF